MEYKFDRPSSEMIRLKNDRFRLMAEMHQEELNNSSNVHINETVNSLETEEAHNKIVNNILKDRMTYNSRFNFLDNVKKSFLSECMFKIYKESSISPLSENDTIVARNLINNFIIENNVNDILRDFKTKNLLLSEINRITTKYYNKVLEDCNNGECREFKLTPSIRDDFYKELEDLDTGEASTLIKHRVADAMDEFIDDNMSNKMDYEEIIKSAQDRMAVMKDQDIANECANTAFVEVAKMKQNRKKNIFHYMVESLAESAFTNDDLKNIYFNESSLNMDKVVNSCQLIYTMLEMVNTTNMLKPISAEYLNDYINSLKQN